MTIEQEAEIARLKTELDFIKQTEFPRCIQLVKDTWSKKVDLLTEERDYYIALLNCVRTNLSKTMPKSIQKLQAKTIYEELIKWSEPTR